MHTINATDVYELVHMASYITVHWTEIGMGVCIWLKIVNIVIVGCADITEVEEW